MLLVLRGRWVVIWGFICKVNEKEEGGVNCLVCSFGFFLRRKLGVWVLGF